MSDEDVIIECPLCNSRVAPADCECKLEPADPDDPYEPRSRVVIGCCPRCKRVLVGRQGECSGPLGESYWSDADRLWPMPRRTISPSVPQIVRLSLNEADICFGASAYAACAVMCGRALEGICVHFKVKRTLAAGLKDLLDQDIIDRRLFNWGDELRKVRNLGAHATTESVSKQDARDVLDFVHAITEYVFVLNEQFDRFMKRRKVEKSEGEDDD